MLHQSSSIPLPRAILFDMDGTITAPLLDFARIRRDMGIAEQRPILEALAELEQDLRDEAHQILARHEHEAAEHSTLNPGCYELLRWLESRDVCLAVVTRNSLACAKRVMELHELPFDVLVTRDDGAFKPDPRPLHLACERLKVAASQAWIVGDGPYDVQAGLAAGVATVWLSHGKPRSFPHEPWRTVRDFLELRELLAACRV